MFSRHSNWEWLKPRLRSGLMRSTAERLEPVVAGLVERDGIAGRLHHRPYHLHVHGV